MRRALTTVVMAAALVQPAIAQRTGSRIGKDAKAGDGTLVAETMAECWVERQTGTARRLMTTLPGSEAEQKILTPQKREYETCLDNDRLVMDEHSVRVSMRTIRPIIATMLMRTELLRRTAPAAPAADSQPWYHDRAGALRGGGYDGAALRLQAFGHCVALADWRGSARLLMTPIGSPDEKVAMTALIPVLAPCVPQNEQVALTRTLVRRSLAEPFYHLMTAKSGGGNN